MFFFRHFAFFAVVMLLFAFRFADSSPVPTLGGICEITTAPLHTSTDRVVVSPAVESNYRQEAVEEVEECTEDNCKGRTHFAAPPGNRYDCLAASIQSAPKIHTSAAHICRRFLIFCNWRL